LTEAKAINQTRPSISNQIFTPSETAEYGDVETGLALIVHCRIKDVEPIFQAIIDANGRIVYKQPSQSTFFILRDYQVVKVLRGDTRELRELYDHKVKEAKNSE